MSVRLAWTLGALVLLLALAPPPWTSDLPPDPALSGGESAAAALLDLALPGVFRPVADAPGRHGIRNPLADALELPDPDPAWPLLPLHAGLTALLLAGYAAAAARGPAGWWLRGVLAAGVLLLLLGGGSPSAASVGRGLVLAGLAGLAGLGLHALRPAGQQPPRGAAELALGTACVALAAAAALLALRAGSASDAVLADPVLRLLAERAPPDAPTWQLAEVTAAIGLRRACDHAALAAFAAMTSILLHLKSRSAPTAVLVLAVAAGELLLPRLT